MFERSIDGNITLGEPGSGFETGLLFEYEFTKHASLASEVEFPKQVLLEILQGESDVKIAILQSLARRPVVPLSIVNLTPWLGDGGSTRWKTAS